MAGIRGPFFVLALVGAISLGAGLALWLERASPADGNESASEEDAARSGDVPADLAVAAAGAREAAEAQGLSPSSRAAVAALARDRLTGRVLDEDGRALAGARVTLTRGEVPGFDVLDPELARASVPFDETQSDADGRFALTLPRALPVDVLATLDGYCDAFRADAYAGEELELVLARGALVLGTLTRARDATPVAGARVRVFRGGGPASLERETSSRADGTYELRVPFQSGATLEVVPVELACSEAIALTFDAEARCRCDVALAEGALATGRVSDAESGAPIAGATVGEGWWFRRTTTTDAHGEYVLRGFGGGGVRELGARAPGYGAASRVNPPVAEAGVVRADFALRPGRSAEGRVVDEDGTPIPGAYVAAVASEFVDGAQRTDWVSTHSDEHGRYRLSDLVPELGHALLVSRLGYGTQVHDLPEDELARRALELPDVILRRPALLAGRVEDARGAAVADAEVELAGANHDRFRFTRGATPRAGSYVDRRTVRSDAAGRFWFGDLAAGRYQLAARVAGRPASAPLAVELVTGERRDDARLVLEEGGTIRGQVLDDRGRALGGVYVSAQSERLRDAAARAPGHVQARTAEDGRFALEGLPDGEYTLRAYPLDTPPAAPGEPYLDATVEHVATGDQPLVIELPRGASIAGRLLDTGGAALAGYVVATAGPDGAPGEYARTDDEGRFRLSVPRGSRWTLEVRGDPRTADFQRVLLRRADVTAGADGLELRLGR